jgi:hypothetical protein
LEKICSQTGRYQLYIVYFLLFTINIELFSKFVHDKKAIKKQSKTIKNQLNLRHMVAMGHKNTNVPLILKMREIIFVCGQITL